MADFSEIIDANITGGVNYPLNARHTVNTHLRSGAMVAI
jgi:hypothetical protein